MGQKVNPIIYRLGVCNNEWNSKYIEKNKEEHTLYNYQNFQIQKYLKEFFEKQGIDIHSIKIYYSQKIIYIYISYIYTKKTLLLLKNNLNQLKFKTKKFKNIRNNKYTKKNILIKDKDKKLSDFLLKEKTKKFKKKKKCKLKRIKIFKKFKCYFLKKKYTNNLILKKNEFLQQILETITKFTNNNFDIKIIFQPLNRGLTVSLNQNEKNKLKKKLLLLKQYSRKHFFKEGLTTMITLIKVKKSANLFANFISKEFKILKKHGAFLLFLKRTLNHLINLEFSTIKGIRIIIKGRFNGAPRAKTKIIVVGNVPIQTIKKQIDYCQNVSYTKNGTFGIKVWLNYN